jgi:hypothetical protein
MLTGWLFSVIYLTICAVKNNPSVSQQQRCMGIGTLLMLLLQSGGTWRWIGIEIRIGKIGI